jgi:hypothetical protein
MTFKRRGPEIIEMLLSGKTNKDIALSLNVSRSSVTHHAKKLGLSKGYIRKYNWDEIASAYNAGATYSQCQELFGVSPDSMWKAAKRGLFLRKCGRTAQQLIDYLHAESVPPGARRGDLRKKILEENLIPYVCALCSIDSWLGKKLVLRLDHIDGDGRNNNLSNLRFLCPNCDSQQDTYCWRNRGKYSAVRQMEKPERSSLSV